MSSPQWPCHGAEAGEGKGGRVIGGSASDARRSLCDDRAPLHRHLRPTTSRFLPGRRDAAGAGRWQAVATSGLVAAQGRMTARVGRRRRHGQTDTGWRIVCRCQRWTWQLQLGRRVRMQRVQQRAGRVCVCVCVGVCVCICRLQPHARAEVRRSSVARARRVSPSCSILHVARARRIRSSLAKSLGRRTDSERDAQEGPRAGAGRSNEGAANMERMRGGQERETDPSVSRI